ncbi:MAG: hypothetical protein II962_06385, partial [Spirochaetales bacterium]|nr:hypothetical protein [Spirochaetales bacterium]
KEMCLTEYDDESEKEILKEQYLEAGRKEGRSEGETIGADRMASLGDQLMKAGRTEDLKRAFSDPGYREKLFQEFNI